MKLRDWFSGDEARTRTALLSNSANVQDGCKYSGMHIRILRSYYDTDAGRTGRLSKVNVIRPEHPHKIVVVI